MRKIISFLMVITCSICALTFHTDAVTCSSILLTGDYSSTYYGTPPGYFNNVDGKIHEKYDLSFTTRRVKNIAGNRTNANVQWTKVISIYGYEPTLNTTKYVTITTKDFTTGNVINNLSVNKTSSWSESTSHSATKVLSTYYQYAIDISVKYESVKNGTTYVGLPNLSNVD